MSTAAVASAANGIARRARVRSLGLRKKSFPASPPEAPAGSLPRLVRCRSMSSAPSASVGSSSSRSYASAACITSAVRGGDDWCNGKALGRRSSDAGHGGRLLAGVAAAGALVAGAREEQTTNRGSENGRCGDDKAEGAGRGGAVVWCDGQAASSAEAQRFLSSSSCGSEGDVREINLGDVHQFKRRVPAAVAAATPRARITDVYRFDGDGEPVGRGQRATVTTATHLRTGESVAVKKLSRAETTRLEVMEEVSLLKVASKHPNVVSLQAFFEDQEAFYIVMEMCEGGELYHRLADKGRYSEGQAARIMAEVASAVGFLHRNAIVHFDLKPENIMLAVGGDDCVPEVRLADFGSAFRQYRQISTARDYTAAYSAPEVLARQSVDEKVDMWALGVVMWVLLTGRHPFGANADLSEAEVARRVAEVEPDLKVLRHVSPEGKDLVRRLLARDPEDRPSAQQVLNHPWLRAVVTRKKAKATSSHRLVRRHQQQHKRLPRPVEGTWGVAPLPPPGRHEEGAEGGGGGGAKGGATLAETTAAAVVASVAGDPLSA